MKIHELKLDTEFFDDVKSGKKNFEIRKNDRDFKIGDILELRAFDVESGEYQIHEKSMSWDYESDWEFAFKELADIVKAKITGIWDINNMFTEAGYVDDIEDSINLDMYEKILDDYFKSDILPLGYVVLGISDIIINPLEINNIERKESKKTIFCDPALEYQALCYNGFKINH